MGPRRDADIASQGDADAGLALDAAGSDEGGSEDGGGDAASCASPALAWTAEGALPLDDGGISPQLTVSLAAPAGVAVRVSAGSGRCVQVDSLVDDDGHVYIGPADYGPYCTACEQRSAVAMGDGLFVFPSNGRLFAPKALHFRFGLRDCPTFGAPNAPGLDGGVDANGPLHVQTLSLPGARSSGHVRLRILITPVSVFYEPEANGDERLKAALKEVNARLAQVGVAASISSVCRLPAGSASDADFVSGDFTALAAIKGQVPDGCAADDGRSIPVILGGCLIFDEPLFGRRSEVQGYTAHIPGGVGGDNADGVYIKGSLCGTPAPVAMDWAPSSLGQVLAHELGHFLGLYHSVESDGTTDQLDDTDANNLMFHTASLPTSSGLSPTQGAIMRRHPLVQECP